MTSLMERVAGERTRLREVRMALTAATDQKAGGDISWAPFYLAIVEYFEASLERLHVQDIRLGELLHKRADMNDPVIIDGLSVLEVRLAGLTERQTKLLAARDDLQAGVAGALEKFEEVAGEFAGYIVANMGHHPGTAEPAAKLFTTEDWEYMTLASEESRQREVELHDKVFSLKPEELELAAK